MQQLTQQEQIFNVLIPFYQRSQTRQSNSTNHSRDISLDQKKLKATRLLIKVLKKDTDFMTLMPIINKDISTCKENKQKFMRIWIILQKYKLLGLAYQKFKEHFRNNLNHGYEMAQKTIAKCLSCNDLKQTYEIYWGQVWKKQQFKKGLAALNLYRKHIRKRNNN